MSDDDGLIQYLPWKEGLDYQVIGGMESTDAYFAKVDDAVGHLVVWSSEWDEDTWCMIDPVTGLSQKESDYNPNPVEQLF